MQEQLIEEALERFKEEFSWNKAPVTTHDDSGNKITPEPLIYEQLEFLKKELSTIASKSAEAERNKHIEIYRWLCGYHDFPERLEGMGAYWWRSHLMQKLLEIGIKSLSKGTK